MVGTDVRSGIFSNNAYCGGYARRAWAGVHPNWLASCSDGFLNCSSQRAAGYVWFNDTQVMSSGRVLNHNQSRRDCFGLDVVLRNDL